MKKIPTVYLRDWDNNPKYVTREPNPDCAWVFAGEGHATRKYDGTCVMFDGECWWARREVKPGKYGPVGFRLVEEDPETGKRMGWEPIEQSSFARFHEEALANQAGPWPEGTYELLGPKINGNPEDLDLHWLQPHAAATSWDDAPRDYDGLREWLHARPYEGIVWHHEDGIRMAKIKGRDFPKENA